MPVRFEGVELFPLRDLSLRIDDGTIVGLVGPDGSGKSLLLELAAGRVQPQKGSVEATAPAALVGIGSRARLEVVEALAANPATLLLDHALAVLDAASLEECIQALDRLRRRGAVVLVSSHDLPLLERISDVVVALADGRIVEQGDPGLVLCRYRTRILERLRRAAAGVAVEPSSRHGDGRAEVEDIEILGENGLATGTVRSGEQVAVVARLRFRETVAEPVAGMLIRNRIGVSVYGTNTQLENAPIGARRAGESVEVRFEFRCDLCPQEYTLTVASHDPDGTAHDWLEEAVPFSVVDTRYTEGVANLRAKVTVK